MKIIISGLPPKDFIAEISSFLNITERPSVIQQRSADPPSVIQILGSVVEWLDLYKLVSIIFISTVTKEAAKELYVNKSKLFSSLRQVTVKPLKAFIDLFFRNKEKITNQNIFIIITLNIPDDYMGTNLQLQLNSEEELAWQFANYIVRLEKIENVIKQLMRSEKPPLAPISLISQDDGSIKIRYMDLIDLKYHEILID